MTCTTNDATAPLAMPPIDHAAPLNTLGLIPVRAKNAVPRASSPSASGGGGTASALTLLSVS